MSVAALTRFAPLLSMATKPVGQLTDQMLLDAATAIGGGDSAETWVELFKTIRSSEPATKVSDLLGSPTVLKLIESAGEQQTKVAEDARTEIFCRCPFCSRSFEISLQQG